MASAAEILGGFSGAGLAQLSNTAARPAFELTFNSLQNTLLDKLNKKIVELNEQSKTKNNVNALMFLEAKKFEAVKPLLDKYAFDTARNLTNISDTIDLLDEMSASNDAGDADDFNSKLESVKGNIDMIIQVNGGAIGMNVSDGLQSVVQDGAQILSYDDYAAEADPAAARADAIAALRTKLTNAQSVASTNYEAVSVLKERVDERLNGILLQMKADQLAGEAERANEVKKLQTEYHDLLNALSLAFEVSQAKNEQLTKSLLQPPEFEKGSILNVFS